MNRIRRQRLVAVAVIVAAVNAVCSQAARAEFRHAIVIGQAAYASGTLAAPPRDVAAVAEALGRAGFTVTTAENLRTAKDLADSLAAFARTVPTNGTALVYVSGHAATAAVAGTPPRAATSLVALDGSQLSLASAVEPLVASKVDPKLPQPLCGSRINVVIVDAGPPANPPATAPASAAAAAPPPHVDPPAETLLIFRGDAGTPGSAAAETDNRSPLAARLVADLTAGRPLDATLTGLSDRRASSLADGELARLAGPASKAVSPPDRLAPGLRAGDEWVDANGIVFCWCPAGEYTIGSPATESGRQRDESQAVVSFAEGFWMAKHELCSRESIILGHFGGRHKLLPITNTAHFRVGALLVKANATAPAGWEYAIPSEAEWEYAARAGTKTAYSFGDDAADLVRHGNFADRSLRESTAVGEGLMGTAARAKPKSAVTQTGLFTYAHPDWSDGAAMLASVGGFLPNPWGLCDVHGNVSEMTSTFYEPARVGPVVPPGERAEWLKKTGQNYVRGAVYKGGSWASTFGACRSAFRGWETQWDNTHGCRLMLRRKGAVLEPATTTWTTLVPTAVSVSGAAVATSGSGNGTAVPTTGADGTVVVTGSSAGAGETYTISCPVPAGVDPREVRIELPVVAAPGGQATGRGPGGTYAIAEVSIAAARGGRPPAMLVPLDVRSDGQNDVRSWNHLAKSSRLIDGRPDTFWNMGRDKQHEAVFTIGLPSHTGSDGARWRYPVESLSAGPITSLVITILHADAALGTFRISVFHEIPAVTKEAAP